MRLNTHEQDNQYFLALAERRAEASKQILKERLLCALMGIAFALFAILVEKALGILFNIPWL